MSARAAARVRVAADRLGKLLERARVSSGLTQEELARRAGTSRPTLSAYEHGRKSPTVATFAWLLSGARWELAGHKLPA